MNADDPALREHAPIFASEVLVVVAVVVTAVVVAVTVDVAVEVPAVVDVLPVLEVLLLDVFVDCVFACVVPADELPEVTMVETAEPVVDVVDVAYVDTPEVAVAVMGLALTENVTMLEVAWFPARSRATANVVYILGVRVVVATKGAPVFSAPSFW